MLQLDLKNAYGRMRRSTALTAVMRKCPGLAPQLAQQWQGGATKAWIRENGEWSQLSPARGIWQGGPDSNPVFCIAQEAAFDEADVEDVGCARIGYADDTFLEGAAVGVEVAWPKVVAALERRGQEVQPPKCGLWHAADAA